MKTMTRSPEPTASEAIPLTLDFADLETPREFQLRTRVKQKREERLAKVDTDSTHVIGADLSDDQVRELRHSYVSTGGNVSETSRRHEVDRRIIQSLAQRYDWPVYGIESTESNRRQRQVALFNKMETQVESMLASLEIEEKDVLDLANTTRRELSKYLEPLASRHSAFKTVYDSWIRLGTILYPEQFAKDPDPHNHQAAEARSQVRDLAILGGVAGLHRQMEEIVERVFVAGVPDRNHTAEILHVSREDTNTEDEALDR